MKRKKTAKKWILALACLLIAAATGSWLAWLYVNYNFSGHDAVRFYIPANASAADIADTLNKKLGDRFGNRVFNLWKAQDSDPAKAFGSYVVRPGDKAVTISRNLRFNRQTPLKITPANARTLNQLYQRIAGKMAFNPEQLRSAADSVLRAAGFSDSTKFPAAFLPYTYELYWTDSPEKFMNDVVDAYKRFWSDSRRAKAKKLGLTPVDVTTIASIVEEETAKPDERPAVARLYLNRIHKGMKLQADPTVKFAIGDFSIRRITSPMLQTLSPYNTYRVNGLPPGPIRIVETATIDAVLDSREHPYLYMCAKED
nr:endolytic transglycosylase MltG [Muribaculaceae bacterium]